ncbi:MAG: gamma-glutamyltransferase [Gemmatimonadota bacterium]|nr:gamma-glutamyltransferase [Gemmatimonadota bacterium]
MRRVRRRGFVPSALLLLAGCTLPPSQAPFSSREPDTPPVARAAGGMVVSGSPYATEAGRRMLAAGGNAVDAAVAAAFALTVAEPTQSGLGGRTQILVRLADGSVHAIDGTTSVPAVYDADTAPKGEHGHGAVGIPGTVAALTRAVTEHGTLPLARVMEPARWWARNGLFVPAGERERFAGIVPELEPGTEVARAFAGPGGSGPAAGALFVQPELAEVLDRVATGGHDAFYRGPVAERIADDMSVQGGFVTLRDLEDYSAEDSYVGRGRYRDLDLAGSYLPASGVTVIEILQILDRLPLAELDEVRWAATLAESLLAGFQDREIAEHDDPAVAVAWLTSDSLADRRAGEVASRLGLVVGARGASAVRDASPRPATASVPGIREGARAGGYVDPPFTTHISVADGEGNVVALTQSLGPSMGARVVTPGLGFLYASTLGGYLAGGGPGYRPWSSQAPLVVTRDGRPYLVAGGAGSRRILSAMVATLSRVVDQQLPLDEALARPRIHPADGVIQVEEGWEGIAGLAAMGYSVEPRPRDWFARLNFIQVEEDGFFGVGEPRWMESAAAGAGRP